MTENMTEQNTAPQAYALPEALTIDTVESLSKEFTALDMTGAVVLDASKLEIITTPGVQLLLSLQKSCAEAGGSLNLSAPHELLTQHFAALGLTPQLTLMEQR